MSGPASAWSSSRQPSPLPSPLLVIESATAVGSVALFVAGNLAARLDVAMGATGEDALFPAVEQLLVQRGISAKSLAAVVCGAGPGSFTSLRIGASLAKGLAFAAGCPLFAVSSLSLAAASIAEVGRYVVHADALRGERYAQCVDVTTDDAIGAAVDVASDGARDGAVDADAGRSTRVVERGPLVRVAFDALAELAGDRRRVAVLSSPDPALEYRVVTADAASLPRCLDWLASGPVSLDAWEPVYGRLAEAQVKWEAVHGHALPPG